jgi:hypothetical protein
VEAGVWTPENGEEVFRPLPPLRKIMTLEILFNFVAADNKDPMSQPDCELLNIRLDGELVPLRVENDTKLNHHLLAALYRLHQIMPK